MKPIVRAGVAVAMACGVAAWGEEPVTALQAQMLEKPARFESWDQRFDFLHHNVPLHLNAQTYRADTMFLDEGAPLAKKQPKTALRLGIYVEAKDDQGYQMKFDPDFEVDVSLPNLESTWKVFVKGSENDELPGTDPTERERGAQIGLRKPLETLHINLDAGVKARWLPEAFAKAEWRPDWYSGKWRWSPRQRVYVESGDGFGEVTSLTGLRWFGARDDGVFQTVSAAKWTEQTDGVEWEQSLKIGRVLSLLDESRRGQSSVGATDARRGYGLRYSIFGHDNGPFLIDRHRLTFLYRIPAYKQWAFLDIMPELEWVNEDNWDTAPGIRIGLDLLFYGDGEV